MNNEKNIALTAVEEKEDLIKEVAGQVWGFAELSLQEERSAALYCDVLENQGFRVERGLCGIATAFSASFGSGRRI